MAVCQELGIESDMVPRIASGFSFGIGGTGALCGAVAAGTMAIGLKYGRQEPWDSRDRPYAPAQEFCRRFREEMGHICCHELTGMDVSTPEGVQAYWHSDVPLRVCLHAGGTAFRLAMEIIQRPEPPAADA
ncbi:MAG: C-GCAxxG-C-C family protein [Dehalococcoidia bacterium]